MRMIPPITPPAMAPELTFLLLVVVPPAAASALDAAEAEFDPVPDPETDEVPLADNLVPDVSVTQYHETKNQTSLLNQSERWPFRWS
jgi:hypothetical protein